jgi:hypothetical protein
MRMQNGSVPPILCLPPGKAARPSGAIAALLMLTLLLPTPANAQEGGVRLAPLPTQVTAKSVRPIAAGRGFNIANVRQASVVQPVRRTVAVQKTAALSAPGASSPQSAIVEHRASGMRLIGAVSLDNLRSVLSVEEQIAASGLLTISDPVEGRQLSRFIGQTSQYVAVNGETALVGWWHPLDDAWIVSKWQLQQGKWQISSMGALLGADLAATPAPLDVEPVFDWARNIYGLPKTIEQHNQKGIRNFMVAVQSHSIEALLANVGRHRLPGTRISGALSPQP